MPGQCAVRPEPGLDLGPVDRKVNDEADGTAAAIGPEALLPIDDSGVFVLAIIGNLEEKGKLVAFLGCQVRVIPLRAVRLGVSRLAAAPDCKEESRTHERTRQVSWIDVDLRVEHRYLLREHFLGPNGLSGLLDGGENLRRRRRKLQHNSPLFSRRGIYAAGRKLENGQHRGVRR